ncbi:MAG: DUF4833 domain-containing protein [Endomicrobia bacterium]|nr:DUF4833 domain-containing protein [Endomicrobiia bacterium]MCL2799602.1 DUF4833 domain-containing protein [Endomicrobiia bacterium]
MKKSLIAGFLLVVLMVPSLYARNSYGLFHIERNKNTNIVQYDANVNNGVIDSKNPIDVYWILHASRGQRAELSSFERRAFGFTVKYNEGGYFDLALNAVPDRNIKVFMVNGEPKAKILINGEEVFLTKVYVSARSNLIGIPRVSFYTIYGTDVNTGNEVSERIDVR